MFRIQRRTIGLFVIAVCTLAGAVPALAQDVDGTRANYIVPVPPTQRILSFAGRVPPGNTTQSPTGFGASWGDIFIGASLVNRHRNALIERGRDNIDGAFGIGVGIGNARDLVGLELGLVSYSTAKGPFKRGGVNAKLHKSFGRDWGIAVGSQNAVHWGADFDQVRSFYGAISHVWREPQFLPLRSLTGTIGAGNGFFDFDLLEPSSDTEVRPFASVAIQPVERASFILDWAGQDLNFGASAVPFPGVPLVFSAALLDIFNRADRTEGVRVMASVGYGLRIRSLGFLVP